MTLSLPAVSLLDEKLFASSLGSDDSALLRDLNCRIYFVLRLILSFWTDVLKLFAKLSAQVAFMLTYVHVISLLCRLPRFLLDMSCCIWRVERRPFALAGTNGYDLGGLLISLFDLNLLKWGPYEALQEVMAAIYDLILASAIMLSLFPISSSKLHAGAAAIHETLFPLFEVMLILSIFFFKTIGFN